jgi:hypothetical protein
MGRKYSMPFVPQEYGISRLLPVILAQAGIQSFKQQPKEADPIPQVLKHLLDSRLRGNDRKKTISS